MSEERQPTPRGGVPAANQRAAVYAKLVLIDKNTAPPTYRVECGNEKCDNKRLEDIQGYIYSARIACRKCGVINVIEKRREW